MTSVKFAGLQRLLDDIQAIKSRKAQVLQDLQTLERDETSAYHRLRAEFNAATELIPDDYMKHGLDPSQALGVNGLEEHPSKKARTDFQASQPAMVFPPSTNMHLGLPTYGRASSVPGPEISTSKYVQIIHPHVTNGGAQLSPHLPSSAAALPVPWKPPAAPSAPPSQAGLQRQNSSSRSTPTPVELDSSQLAAKERQLQLAVKLRSALGDVDARSINMKLLLKTGILAGEQIEYRKQSGTIACNSGVLTQQGCVLCNCAACKGQATPGEISCSLFEEHSGSSMKRPADFIWLAAYRMTIKELIGLVQSVDLEHVCRICGHGADRGELLCCDVCSSGFHGGCLGITQHSGRGPECPACKAKATGTPFSIAIATPPPMTSPPPPELPSAAPPATNYRPPAPPTSGRATPGSPANARPPESAAPTDPDDRVSHAVHHPAHNTQAATSPPAASPLPPAPGAPSSGAPPASNTNKQASRNRRLFLEGVLQQGEPVKYVSAGETKLQGVVHISESGTGILCACCNKVVSCSQFEQHAGFGQRRAPYDNIRTEQGLTLKQLADRLPAEPLVDPSATPIANLVEEEGVMSSDAADDGSMEAAEQPGGSLPLSGLWQEPAGATEQLAEAGMKPDSQAGMENSGAVFSDNPYGQPAL